MRLFVSIDLPDRLAGAIADAQERFADAEGLRFVDPAQAHLTLFFLGETGADRLDEIEPALERAVDGVAGRSPAARQALLGDADVDPFELRIGGFGVFPSLDYISVIWTGVRDGGGAAETTLLHEAVERELTALGFEGDDREFTPHITIARMDDARGKDLVQRVVGEADPDLGAFRVERINLKESTLTSDGPVYETAESFEL